MIRTSFLAGFGLTLVGACGQTPTPLMQTDYLLQPALASAPVAPIGQDNLLHDFQRRAVVEPLSWRELNDRQSKAEG